MQKTFFLIKKGTSVLQVHPWNGSKAAPRAQSFGYEQEVAIHSELSNPRYFPATLALPGLCHGPDLPGLLGVFSITSFRNSKAACPGESRCHAGGGCSPYGDADASPPYEEGTWLMNLGG